MSEKVVIIGGMAAGCKAAARLKRLEPNYKVVIIEKLPILSFGACGMPFYASGDIDDFKELASAPWGTLRDADFFEKTKGIKVFTETEAKKINHDSKKVYCKSLNSGKEFSIDYDYLIIASGSEALKPPFPAEPREKISSFKNPYDAKNFREKAQTGRIGKVAIIGGGSIGCELAESMTALWGIETHLIELTDRLLPTNFDKEMSEILVRRLQKNDVKIHLNAKVKKVSANKENNPTVIIEGKEEIEVDYVFVCAGIKPNVELAESIGCEIGDLCGIIVDENMRTSIPNVWAAGDCVETRDLITERQGYFPLGSLANRQGKVAADSIAGINNKFSGALGAVSLKIFGLNCSVVGLNESSIKRENIDYDCVWGTWYDRPHYMPGSKTLFGKMIYDKKDLRLLGFQLFGEGEATRYIDAFSVYASDRKTATDLLNFEHAYCPPHSSPMNPLNFLGSMAIAQKNDNTKPQNPKFLDDFEGQILDIRENVEKEQLPLKKENHSVTLDKFRDYVEKLDKNKPVLVVCQKGVRAYEATRFLKKRGFKDVSYLGGGIQLYEIIFDKGE